MILKKKIVKKSVLSFLAIASSLLSVAQLQSPDSFLGYKLGERYTPHHNVVRYFQHVSANAGNMTVLNKYGETNEHRPLYTCIISSEENIRNIENIRKNNLRLAQLEKDRMAANENAPAIVWLSYNVHGNETSSSEAAMLTLYSLVDPSNVKTKEWLKNTVVIIDPCLNPDGRDRYVNWFNSIAGKLFNPQRIAREHQEPWPGGRTNHYNFDLNRDWAWQTQVESQQRIAVYNQWMPHVHVDFHEQGPSQPYYFAPAAQPYHDVITPWQRDFQVTIGKNNAKYFDQNNWLFFTKEIFDLLYPSYGDTYPTFNGSVGMTYEQAGGPAGGLGIITDEGDTLTLHDRLMHHTTTGLSTIEISSIHAQKLLQSFRSYFSAAVSGGIGEYKSYIIRNTPADAERIRSLLLLLDKNDIRYGSSNGTGKGYNYHSKKEESFTIAESDIVISTMQPKAAMLKVLFEPETKLVDSATYDITAWALPYAYGLTAYATKQHFSVKNNPSIQVFNNNTAADKYGYAIRWQGIYSAKAVAALLKNNIRLRYVEKPFELDGNRFESGTIVILKNGNEKFGSGLWQFVANICNEARINMVPLSSGMVDKGNDFGSYYVHPMKAPRIALVTGAGINSNAAGEIWHFFDKELDYPVTLVNSDDVSDINWPDIDVLILPDGRHRYLSDKGTAEKIKQWVENGGRIVALESAVSQLSKQDWSALHLKSGSDTGSGGKDPYDAIHHYDCREREEISGMTPGSIFKVEIDNTHPLMFGYPKHYYSLKMDTNIYDFMKEGWNAGVIKKNQLHAGFVGHKLSPQLNDALVFGAQQLGGGQVVFITDNIMFRDFWENGKLMLCNAVFMVGQ